MQKNRQELSVRRCSPNNVKNDLPDVKILSLETMHILCKHGFYALSL